jgi:hypothetical protein
MITSHIADFAAIEKKIKEIIKRLLKSLVGNSIIEIYHSF